MQTVFLYWKAWRLSASGRAMYIGSVSTKGLNHLIYEMVDNSVDEHLAGYCSEIRVTLEKDGSCTVSDNGRGVPVGMHAKGLPAARIVYTHCMPAENLMTLPTRPAEDFTVWVPLS